MEQYIWVNDEGYLIGVSDGPFTNGLREMVYVPDGLDLERMDCYRYVGGEFVWDEDKWMERERAREAAEDQLDPITQMQLALTELYEAVMNNG